jgi:hypothetical protein
VQKKVTAEGKEKYYLPGPVYKDHKAAVELRQKAVEIFGEDVTPEALEVRQKALMGQERLYADLLSGDPQTQANVVRHFLQEAKTALENGEIGADPMLGFTDAMLDTLAREHPDADARVLRQSTRRVFDDVYERAAELADGRTVEELQAAAKAGDSGAQRALNLLYSVQHLDREIFKQFKKAGEIKARTSDPLAIERERLQARQAELDRREAAAATERWRAAVADMNAKIGSAVSAEVETALAEAKAQYAKFPSIYEDSVKTLTGAVNESIRNNTALKGRVELLKQQARQAVSPERRLELAEQIAKLYGNYARQVAAIRKTAVLTERVKALKAQSDATHQRREAAAQHRAPGGGGAPVKRSIAPVPGAGYEVATRDNLMRDLEGLTVGR